MRTFDTTPTRAEPERKREMSETMKNVDLMQELSDKATQGVWDRYILDRELKDIGAYVQGCIDAGPGRDFWFISGIHDDGGTADIAHIGNGPRSEANTRFIVACVNEIRRQLAEKAQP